jgi:hypothetical protein
MPPRRARAQCPYCGDPIQNGPSGDACASGCPVVTCPRCNTSVAPFLNPDGSVPPGPHACAHLAVVAPSHDVSAVPHLQVSAISTPPALPRPLATRPIPEAVRAEAFGDRAPILAAWRRLTSRPSADAVLHAIVAHRGLGSTVAVVHPAGDVAEVGAVAFAADATRARAIILEDDRALRDGFRTLTVRLGGNG